ncbi:maleylpyruvate isomerase N-terminal domain-containing protein [Plantactinospora sp. KLBMP9567]|uniref:maleylpyruvate isomerase N-terminal domain-containing protein n=1 Tax=Plantactinospora sp. KLBMP9567 TaxID=3085900 RepID=UPI002980D922|nr:maleylpyruvate isomerase N-terminal domain-containing protein [Plantactinospora sp. KLBMP9567]
MGRLDGVDAPRAAGGELSPAPGSEAARAAEPRRALGAAYDRITATIDGLADADLLRPTRCRGWFVVDLLLHLVLDAQRALVTLASPVVGPADVDGASYWLSPSDPDEGRHAAWVRRSAAAFDRPRGVVRLWTDTAPAAVRAAAAADPLGYLTTQGHVLAVPEFLATLVTEAVVHHLDLTVDLPGAPEPEPDGVAIAVATLDGLLSAEAIRPADWSDTDYLLKGTGRLPLTAHDRLVLGEAAGWFPLLG